MKFDKRTAFISFLLMLLSWQGLSCGGEVPSGLPSQPLTLKEAVSYALNYNRGYLAAKREVDSVSQQVKQARADFYPKVDASYAFTNWKDQPYAIFNDLQFDTAPQMTIAGNSRLPSPSLPVLRSALS